MSPLCCHPALQREDLGRVQPPAGIEGRAHAHLLREIDLAELERHQIAFLDADAMLAGETAADFDTELEDFLAYLLGFLLLDRIVDL